MMSPLRKILELSEKPERIVVGLMSGTSADSIATAVCRARGSASPGAGERVTLPGPRLNLLHYQEFAFPAAVRQTIIEVNQLDVRSIAELNVTVGELFAEACLRAIEGAGMSRADLDLVGSHGQTVYHHSSVPGTTRATLQVGDGDVIAEWTGALVISDFRSRDIAAGGEGAPLTPLADRQFFPSEPEGVGTRRIVLNLGGIANITVLEPNPAHDFGFDTGPANALLDRLAVRITGGRLTYDRDGEIARQGLVNEPLLKRMLETDPYLSAPPPKSTGFEMYGDAFLDQAEDEHGGSDADLMATLTEFTARSIAQAIVRFVLNPPVHLIIVAGGGARNPFLIERIRKSTLSIPIRDSADFGIPSLARESMAFALFADEALMGRPTSMPNITGIRHPAILGKWSLPPL